MCSIKKISMQHNCVIAKPPTWLKEESTHFFFEASGKMPAFNLHSIAFIQVTDNQHSSTRSCVDSQDNHYQHSSADWTHWQHTHEKYSSTLRRHLVPSSSYFSTCICTHCWTCEGKAMLSVTHTSDTGYFYTQTSSYFRLCLPHIAVYSNCWAFKSTKKQNS